jgi:hypothetical protein
MVVGSQDSTRVLGSEEYMMALATQSVRLLDSQSATVRHLVAGGVWGFWVAGQV